MLELPIWVHHSWRALFEQRWRRARPLLVLSLGVTPLVVAGGGLAALAAYGAPGAAVLAVTVVFLAPPIPYLWWFLFAGRVAERTDFWGTRVGCAGFLQAIGISAALKFAPDELGTGVTLGIPAAGFGLAILGGVAGWRAHAILLDDTGGILAATSMLIEEPATVAVEPTGYAGNVRVDGTSLTWSLHWSRPGWSAINIFEDRIALNEILDVRVAPVADPMSVPPLGFLSDGRTIRPYRGDLLVIRTPQREVGVPATHPHRLHEQLTVRLNAIRSSPSGLQR